MNLSKGNSVRREEALELANLLFGMGLKGEVAGSVWKGGERHEWVHDLDIVMREADWEANLNVLKALVNEAEADKLPLAVEFYIAEDSMYRGVLDALRATHYEVIKGRMMKGLRFRKMRLEDIQDLKFC